MSYAMLSWALQTVKPVMQQFEGNDKSFNRAMHYLPCVFDTIQHQQQVKGCVPHHSMESDRCKKEWAEIMWSLQGYAHMCLTTHGYPSPISLDNKLRNLVLPPELYDSLFLPQPMVPPSAINSHKERPLEKNNDDDDMTPAAASGSSAATLCMRNFAATSMEQENKTDWDSESDHFRPAGLSDQEGWDDDNHVDMGDFPAVANEPPTIKHSCMEWADSSAEAPTSNTHPPDPAHSSTPDSSPVANKDMAVPDPDCDEDTKEGEKTEQDDVVIEEEYKEELDHEDDGPTNE